ncbi:MAG: PqqD family protein [Mariprofundaceae bacterium]
MNAQAEFSIPEYPVKRPSLIGEELMGMDETIYVDAESGTNVSVNVIGAAILELCDGSHTPEQIAAVISESVQGDAEKINNDTHRILLEFATYGLFTE